MKMIMLIVLIPEPHSSLSENIKATKGYVMI